MDDKKVITVQTADGSSKETKVEILPGETVAQIFQTVSETFGNDIDVPGRLCRKNGETLSGNLYKQVQDGDIITYEPQSVGGGQRVLK